MATPNLTRRPVLSEENDDLGDLVAKLLPWGMSFLLHAGLVMVSVFLAWTVTSAIHDANDAPIVPVLIDGPTPGQPLSMSESDHAASDYSQERPSIAPSRMMPSTLFTRGTGPGGNRPGRAPGHGTVGGPRDGWTGSNGFGDGLGPGSDSAKANPFAPGITSDRGFRTAFIGNSGNGKTIIYLVDASGSLIDSFPFVLRELQRSIGGLSDRQSFTVVFFQGGDAIEVPPLGLKRATPEVKQNAIQWVDPDAGNIIPMNQSNPIKALRRALAYKPDLLFILSDNITGSGVNEVDQRRLLADIDDANQSRTKINTIQFLYRDKLTNAGLRGTLELIADRTGGVYTFLDGKKLGIQ